MPRWKPSAPVREPATVPEQVDGLQQSDDILRLLPTELSTLGMTELEYEFYRRLVEKQLLTYRLHGEARREKSANVRWSIRILMSNRAAHLLFVWIHLDRWAVSTNSVPKRSAGADARGARRPASLLYHALFQRSGQL